MEINYCEIFNEKYKDYLEEGHYGLDINNKEVFDYLSTEFEELIKIPNFSYSQIKSKFNWFCFYCNNVPTNKVKEIEKELGIICNK